MITAQFVYTEKTHREYFPCTILGFVTGKLLTHNKYQNDIYAVFVFNEGENKTLHYSPLYDFEHIEIK